MIYYREFDAYAPLDSNEFVIGMDTKQISVIVKDSLGSALYYELNFARDTICTGEFSGRMRFRKQKIITTTDFGRVKEAFIWVTSPLIRKCR